MRHSHGQRHVAASVPCWTIPRASHFKHAPNAGGRRSVRALANSALFQVSGQRLGAIARGENRLLISTGLLTNAGYPSCQKEEPVLMDFYCIEEFLSLPEFHVIHPVLGPQ